MQVSQVGSDKSVSILRLLWERMEKDTEDSIAPSGKIVQPRKGGQEYKAGQKPLCISSGNSGTPLGIHASQAGLYLMVALAGVRSGCVVEGV